MSSTDFNVFFIPDVMKSVEMLKLSMLSEIPMGRAKKENLPNGGQ